MNKYTDLIDKYLSGEMNAAEKLAFEKQLESTTELKTELEIQKQILKGIETAGVKSEIYQGFKKGSFKSKAGKWMMGLAITVLAVATVIVVKDKVFDKKENIRYELNEENNKNWSEADKQLSPQLFEIKGNSDTVIETTGGIILQIPARAFVNGIGDDVTDDYELEVKEAMTPLDIMKAGLSTTSDGQLLETGGMFYINARKDGKNLNLTADRKIYASIPDNNPGKKMMLFDGKRMPDGQINWIDPKPIVSALIPVDIMSLDFYPPHFLDSLKSLGFDIKDKRVTDSVYYSFVCGEQIENDYESEDGGSIAKRKAQSAVAIPVNTEITRMEMEKRAQFIIDSITMTIIKYPTDSSSVVASSHGSMYHHAQNEHPACEIAPSRIRAIWDKKFNNTLLATKEFEARLREIFKTCNYSLLDLYVKNMDKKMYEIDSLAMPMTGGSPVFCDFYNKRQGGVSMKSDDLKKLHAYMEQKRKIYEETAVKTLRRLYKKENIEDEKAMYKMNDHNFEESKRMTAIFKEELETNMKEAYRQLGKVYDKTPAPAPAYLETNIQSMGWKNVDAYVIASTVNRETLDYTDPKTGKKAVIRYEPFTIKVGGSEKYDRVVAYLIPDKLSSFQNMPEKGKNVFKENLNELFKYSAVVFGFKGDGVYSAAVADVKSGEVSVTLKEMSKKDLKTFSTFSGAASRDLMQELSYQVFEQKDSWRRKQIAKREEIRRRLMPVVFPCGSYPQAPAAEPGQR